QNYSSHLGNQYDRCRIFLKLIVLEADQPGNLDYQ
ncbi:MAG: hypothetical protein ACI82A_001925, partial [Candidatus Azotimanducaceae bacterium]